MAGIELGAVNLELSEADQHFCSSHGANCGGWNNGDALNQIKIRGVVTDTTFPYMTAFDNPPVGDPNDPGPSVDRALPGRRTARFQHLSHTRDVQRVDCRRCSQGLSGECGTAGLRLHGLPGLRQLWRRRLSSRDRELPRRARRPRRSATPTPTRLGFAAIRGARALAARHARTVPARASSRSATANAASTASRSMAATA